MTKIAVVLTEGYADWECAYLIGAGRAFYGLTPVIVTPRGSAVVSMGNLTTLPMEPLEIISPQTYDILVLCGGTGWEQNEYADVIALADRFLLREKTVAAICGATLGLARAGLLNDRAHTSNGPEYLKDAPDYRGGAHYRDVKGSVRDKRLITAPGSAPAHFTAEIFREAGVPEAQIKEFLAMVGAEHIDAAANAA